MPIGYEEAGAGDSQLPGYEEATPDVAILEEAAKFTGEVLAPLNWPGDQEGCTLTPQGVTMPRPAGRTPTNSSARTGWNGVTAALPSFGGQGLPKLVRRARRCGSRPTCPSRCARC
jgi:hypothetical protein